MNPRDADHRDLKLAPGGAKMTIASSSSDTVSTQT